MTFTHLDSPRRTRIPGNVDSNAGTAPQQAPPTPAPSFEPQINSISLDGSTEHFSKTTSDSAFNSGEWTSMCWVKKTDNFTATPDVMWFHTSGFPNAFTIQGSNAAHGRLDVSVWEDNGSDRHFIRDDSFWVNGDWVMITVTHSSAGDQTVLYKNASSAGTDSTPLNFSAADKKLQRFGGSFLGTVHSLAWWGVVLDSAAITEIYNGGDGTNFDLNEDTGNYTASANLAGWWRTGQDDSDNAALGQNFATGGPTFNIQDNGANITTADVVADSPT